jgi:hypothetical protein
MDSVGITPTVELPSSISELPAEHDVDTVHHEREVLGR